MYFLYSFIFLKSMTRINVTLSFILGLADFESVVTISPPDVKATLKKCVPVATSAFALTLA